MSRLHFPEIKRPQFLIRNVNELYAEQLSFGTRAADHVAKLVGSWTFIIVQSILLIIWIIVNSIAFAFKWDPYPFILMNLVLSTQAAFTAPIIMMSQNRQSEKDRVEAHQDFVTDQKAAADIEIILQQIEAQNLALQELHKLLSEVREKVG